MLQATFKASLLYLFSAILLIPHFLQAASQCLQLQQNKHLLSSDPRFTSSEQTQAKQDRRVCVYKE